jgi:hypothetical protein
MPLSVNTQNVFRNNMGAFFSAEAEKNRALRGQAPATPWLLAPAGRHPSNPLRGNTPVGGERVPGAEFCNAKLQK